MENQQAIGVFDSGVGGTSIWQEIVTQLPFENTIYLADSKYAPYGTRSSDEIISLSIKNTERLIDLGSKIIVVACNTATTNAIDYLRTHYDIPFIGIEPAIKPAALQSITKSIGILATKGTLNSNLFHSTMDKYAQDVNVLEVIGEGLVPLIEANQLESEELKTLLTSYVELMLDAGIDHLVLGCSHYPFLIPQLKKILPTHVKIIDSGLAVAKQTETVLSLNGNLKIEGIGSHMLYSNKDVGVLESFVSRFRESELKNNTVNIRYLDF
ncbi:glutamate racemase [Dokdonia sp. Hel_I_53]|uniref:glutamate racemase n=1 Tax=Dokdonia sp. Hel_I_53 TaxID=1566287 RepID=UPI00119A6D1E|nr:glutamate racemase [Dokdonia sp. Hel_I_53]TVZ52360.1 glutamate racemase [Dokdonia sp. Hel_I_53]